MGREAKQLEWYMKRKPSKKPKMDYRGNDLLSATWGTLNISEHLSDFGVVQERARRKAVIAAVLSIVAAVAAIGVPLMLLHR